MAIGGDDVSGQMLREQTREPGKVYRTDNPQEFNPKAARALLDDKQPLEFILWHPLRALCRVLRGGARKYGVRNWRLEPICTSTYEAAIARHLSEWAEGHDVDPDSGEHPLAHVAASCFLVMDAMRTNTLIDDRQRAEVIGRTE
jgi:hypothetical protein